jgi:hypothetical protein
VCGEVEMGGRVLVDGADELATTAESVSRR